MSRNWTPEQLELLKQHYATTTKEEIVAIVGRSINSCYNKAYQLGLKKSKDVIRSYASVLAESGKAHRFNKGNIPANKGKKMPKEVYLKVSKTMFKKGTIPPNYQPLGTISIRQNHKRGVKYKYIKVAEPNQWEQLHRYEWKKHHGPIPKGMNVQFKDGNSLNCDISNLYLVSRAFQIRENYNGGAKLPAQVKETIQLIYSITSKIKHYEKQN